jgi:hypothetical protein
MRTLQVAIVHLLQLQSALLLHLLDAAVQFALLLISHHLRTPSRPRESSCMQGLHSLKIEICAVSIEVLTACNASMQSRRLTAC